MEKFDEIFDYLTLNLFFTYDELDLLCCINGRSVETLNSAIYARFGYRDVTGLLEELV